MPDTSTDRLRTAVRATPMFRGLAAADLQRVLDIAILREMAKGEALWHAGDVAAQLTIVVRGCVKIVRHGAGGDVLLEIFRTGETVGAVAVYNKMPYPASCFAMESTTLLCLPAVEFFDLLERYPGFARAVIAELTRLNMALGHKLEEMRGQRVDVRIARLFLMLAERIGREVPEGTEIPLALSRQEIAEMVGTTIESAIRVMSRWGREGVLITGEKRFVLPSEDALLAIVEGGGAE